MADMKQTWAGATQSMKVELQRQVDAATYGDITTAAHLILGSLPKKYPLGTLTAALMLAATAYAEGASHADALINAASE